MKKSTSLYVAALVLASAGMVASCSNELDAPAVNPDAPGQPSIVHPSDIFAWSGNQTFSSGSSRASRVDQKQREMPDFAEWCGALTPSFPATCPAVPEGAIVVTPQNYYTITFTEGETYVFSGESEFEHIALADFPADVTIFIDGKWTFFDSRDDTGLSADRYPTIYVPEGSLLTLDSYEGDAVTIKNLNLYNYGYTVVYDWDKTINDGFTIYNAGQMNIENNNEPVTDITIDQPIYSTGTIRFGGSTNLNADNYYMKEMCVDGMLTLNEGVNLQCGYLNTDQLLCENGAAIEIASEGLIVAGTIAMHGSSAIQSERSSDLGAILTNEILGARKDYEKSEVNTDNFSSYFRNVDIYVTKTINNSQDNATIESYVPGLNGTTTSLQADEFDASENDQTFDVNGVSCGGGYEYLPGKKTVEPEQPSTPEQPGVGDDNPTTPDTPALRHDNEVEVNLTINDSHNTGEKKHDISDLWSKLSIHVRKGTDVRIVMPVPDAYFCESDDFAIRGVDMSVIHADDPIRVDRAEFNIAGKQITLTVTFTSNAIIVTTDGIDQEVIDYLYETTGDGLNFEIWTYFQTEYRDAETGEIMARDGVSREDLQNWLNQSTIKFLDEEPDYYINAFGSEDNGARTPGDCTVSITDSQKGDYRYGYEGEHLNGSEYNEIHVRNGADPAHSHAR